MTHEVKTADEFAWVSKLQEIALEISGCTTGTKSPSARLMNLAQLTDLYVALISPEKNLPKGFLLWVEIDWAPKTVDKWMRLEFTLITPVACYCLSVRYNTENPNLRDLLMKEQLGQE